MPRAELKAPLTHAQVELESFGSDIDYDQLEGTWRLIYTTALDVVGAPLASEASYPASVMRSSCMSDGSPSGCRMLHGRQDSVLTSPYST